MALKPRKNQVVNGYKIERPLGQGAFSWAFEASKDGKKVFLKCYKSPGTALPWYSDYVAYEKELKRRIEDSVAKNFCVGFGEFFEAKVGMTPDSITYFQTFEFVEGGADLQAIVDGTHSATFDQRVIMAKLMLASISVLHNEARVVHADLKPPNIQLFPDPSIKAGYRVKLIDMDRSLLVDKKAPWAANGEGHTGTPNYYSPEHLKGMDPTQESDVFTLSLILYELLAQGNPYASNDPEEYSKQAIGGNPPAPVFNGPFDAPALESEIAECMMNALNPNPKLRPTAMDLNKALNGKLSPSEPTPRPVPPAPLPSLDPSSVPSVPVVPVSAPPVADTVESVPLPSKSTTSQRQQLKMTSDSGELILGIRTEFSERLARNLGPDSRYVDKNLQFVLVPKDSEWIVEPAQETVNETLLNGNCITQPTTLKTGDVLAIGREARGVQKLLMTVKIG